MPSFAASSKNSPIGTVMNGAWWGPTLGIQSSTATWSDNTPEVASSIRIFPLYSFKSLSVHIMKTMKKRKGDKGWDDNASKISNSWKALRMCPRTCMLPYDCEEHDISISMSYGTWWTTNNKRKNRKPLQQSECGTKA
uniref:Uncharacterized protein n=1 Tax=Trypanosoma congolense (strain IL3000) TaxID=1068625 RepID=G0URR9_TRYCI|nr:hypothetical protein, unlikely [Trypanosoma congolense IL3000]